MLYSTIRHHTTRHQHVSASYVITILILPGSSSSSLFLPVSLTVKRVIEIISFHWFGLVSVTRGNEMNGEVTRDDVWILFFIVCVVVVFVFVVVIEKSDEG